MKTCACFTSSCYLSRARKILQIFTLVIFFLQGSSALAGADSSSPVETAFAQYKLNDSTANTTIADDSPAKNNATANVNTSTMSGAGKINSALSFNGTNQYVNLTNLFDDIRGDAVGSFSLWVKPVNGFPILEFNGPGGYFSVEWYKANQSATFAISGGGTPISVTTAKGSLPANVFSHLVISQDGTKFKIYINGVEQTGLTYWFKSNPGAWFKFLAGSITNSRLGSTVEGNSQSFFNGSIDDLRYYKNALSDNDVLALYNNGAGTEATNPIAPVTNPTVATAYAQFKLNDSAATTAVTEENNPANNAVSNVNTSVISGTGKINKAFSFNGSSQYIDIKNLFNNIRGDATGAFSLWVKPVNGFPILEFNGPGGYFSVEWYKANQSATFAISGGGTPISVTTAKGSLPANVFSHLVISQDGTKFKIYINGVEQTGLTYWFKSNPGAWFKFLAGSITNSRLGSTVEGNSQSFFNGSIDDLRYYKNALSSDDVLAIYNLGAGTEDKNPAIGPPTPTPTPIPTPTVTLTANPASIGYNTTATLTWSSTNATSCTTPWGSAAKSGTYTTPNLTTTTSYNVTCTSAGGSKKASVTVTVASAPPPTAPVNGQCGSANGTAVSVAPTTRFCTAGTATTVSGTGPWTWSCAGNGGGSTASCSANKIASSTSPTLFISATPSSVASGGTSVVSWNSTETTSCTAPWGNVGKSGQYTTPPLTVNITYTLSCTGSGGTVNKSVGVNVGGNNLVRNQNLTNIPVNGAKMLGLYAPTQLPGCDRNPASITEYSRFTYDSNNHQMLMWGGGHATSFRDDVDVFNLNTLTWGSAYNTTAVSQMVRSNWNLATGGWISTNVPHSRHSYDLLTFAPNRGELVIFAGATAAAPSCMQGIEWVMEYERTVASNPGKVWHYNPVTKVWRATNVPATASTVGIHSASEYDPVSGKIILIERYGLFTYDPMTEVATKHQDFTRGELSIVQNLIYYPPNQKMYYVLHNGGVFEVTLDRANFASTTIIKMTGLTGSIPTNTISSNGDAAGWAYDSTNQIIGGGVTNGVFYAFNPITKAWTSKAMNSLTPGMTPGVMDNNYALDYDPVNNVFIFISQKSNPDNIYLRHTWVYRYGDGTSAVPNPVNGSCGASHNQLLTSAPTVNLCSSGSASAFSGTGPWTWSCSGSNGGTTSSCSAVNSAAASLETMVGPLTHDGPATPEQISLYLPVVGPLSQTAVATVRYQQSNSSSWLIGHSLFRIQPSFSEGTQADAFAWPLIGMVPGATYNVEVTVTNGGSSIVRTLTHTTRSLPSAAGTPNKIILAGSSSETIQAAIDGLKPGDVIEFKNGNYTLNNLNLRHGGTANAPIYIRGESRNGVTLTDTTDAIILIQAANNVVIENMTLQGSRVDSGIDAYSRGVSFHVGNVGLNQTRITLRNLTLIGVDQGIKAHAPVSELLVYSNTLLGNNKWDQDYYGWNGRGAPGVGDGIPDLDENAFWNDDGINATGNGNVAFNNTLNGFGDSFAMAQNSNSTSYGVHFYRNDVRNSGDDLLEADYSTRNLSFYDNRSHNSMTFLSMDPVNGGPLLFARNIGISPGRTPFKWNSMNSGQFILNNTVIRTARAGSNDNGSLDIAGWYQSNNGEQRSYGFQNNIFIYKGASQYTMWLENSGSHNPIDWSYNSWYPDRRFQINEFGDWVNLAAAKVGIRTSTPVFSGLSKMFVNDNITSENPFTVPVVLGSNHLSNVTGTYIPTLLPNSTPKNSGVAIPNITDGFSGAAPDRGALISGIPNPSWGDSIYIAPTTLPSIVNGACGSSNAASFSTTPTTNLCTAGTGSAISGTGPWTWSCVGTSGGTTASCTANSNISTVTLTANPTSIGYNAMSTLTWSSTNATSCTTPWGSAATSGNYTTPSLTTTTTYTILCSGPGGAKSTSTTLTVAPDPNPPTLPAANLPSWVPEPGRVAKLTQSNGRLTNTFISTTAPYYEPFYSAKIVNDYSTSIFNPYFGDYGAILFYGGGHAATNDNSVMALVIGKDTLTFKRMTNPSPIFGSDTSPTTRYNNSVKPTTGLTNDDYCEYTIDGQPVSVHSYGAGDIIGPENGGATYGTFIQVVCSAGTKDGLTGGEVAHKVDFNSLDGHANGGKAVYKWQRITRNPNSISAGVSMTLGAPVWSAFVPTQNRIYYESHAASRTRPIRWFDTLANKYVEGTGTPRPNDTGPDTGIMFYVQERNVIVFADEKGGQLRVRYMDVSVTQPSWSNVVTLSKPLSIPETWAAALWCPDNNRILTGNITSDDNAIYEITIPSNLSDTWTVERAPLTNGDTIQWAPSTTYKKWSYNPKIKSVIYMPYANPNGGDDTVYVYRPRNVGSTTPPDTTAPTVPANLRSSNVTQLGSTLNWDASTDNIAVASYTISRNATVIGSVPGTVYNDNNLKSNTTYVYTVLAYDSAGNKSTPSAPISITTSSGSTAPTLTLTANPMSVMANSTTTLKWSSTNTTSCSTSWGATTTSGTYMTPPLTSSTPYTITCTGPGGANSASVSVNISTPTTPLVSGRYRSKQPYLFQTVPAKIIPNRIPGGSDYYWDRYGPTYKYVDLFSGWQWKNLGGDWIDSNFINQGNTPWFSIPTSSNVPLNEAHTYQGDITKALSYVFNSGRWNAFLFNPKNAPRAIATLFDKINSPPKINVVYKNGTTGTLNCRIVASNSSSSLLPNTTGNKVSLPAFIEFDKPLFDVQSATLSFVVVEHWSGSNAAIEGYLLDPPVNSKSIDQGVALNSGLLDANITALKGVLGAHRYIDGKNISDFVYPIGQSMVERNFDPAIYGTGPQDLTKLPHAGLGKWVNVPTDLWSLVSSSYSGGGFKALAPGLGALRIVMKAEPNLVDGSVINYSGSFAGDGNIFLPEPLYGNLDHIFIRYYFRLGTPYQVTAADRKQFYYTKVGGQTEWTTMAGKWGIVPDHSTSYGGYSGSSGGGDGWQMRNSWYETDAGMGGPSQGGWAVGFHLYDFNYKNPPGHNYGGYDTPPTGTELWGQGGMNVLYAEKWYCIETELKLNTITESAPGYLADGVLRTWIDGRLAYESVGMVFRTKPTTYKANTELLRPIRSLGIRNIKLNWFHGGKTPATIDRTSFYTGLVWSTKYIGPMKLTCDPTTQSCP